MNRPVQQLRACAGAIIAATLIALANAPAHAHWAMPEQVPVDRLVANLSARTKENPQDASAWYSLGRAHSYAFTLKTTELGVFNGDPAPSWMQGWQVNAKPDGTPLVTPEQLQSHLIEGVKALSKAIELDPTKAECCLSLASLLEAGRKHAGDVAAIPGIPDPAAVPEVHTLDDALAHLDKKDNLDRVRRALRLEPTPWGLEESRESVAAALFRLRDSKDKNQRKAVRELLKQDWQEQTKDLYFRAFTLALEKDSKLSEQPLRGAKSLVAYEAADGYVKAVKADGERAQDKVRVAACNATMKAWDGLPPSGIITPIVLSLDAGKSLDDLLAPDARVNFDLDATASGRTWSWVRPDTGILVWDPERKGQIVSGRQLFGSVSWWMMFDNGYDALSALDDDRDGQLRANELAGIGVWFDRDCDGISDAGEVTPVESLGIAAIATRHAAMDGRSPMNNRGLVMTDGRVLPTWDWVTEAVQNPQGRTQRDRR